MARVNPHALMGNRRKLANLRTASTVFAGILTGFFGIDGLFLGIIFYLILFFVVGVLMVGVKSRSLKALATEFHPKAKDRLLAKGPIYFEKPL